MEKTKRIAINLPMELWRQLKMASIDLDSPMKDIGVKALESWLEQRVVSPNQAPKTPRSKTKEKTQ